jgi:hypothetical protein
MYTSIKNGRYLSTLSLLLYLRRHQTDGNAASAESELISSSAKYNSPPPRIFGGLEVTAVALRFEIESLKNDRRTWTANEWPT